MEILQLKYFCDAAQEENFSKTAKKFLVPPSNISQTVKRLEKELGVPLFTRQSNKIVLNEAGELFYKSAKAALDTLEHAEKTLKNLPQANTVKINIHICRRVVMEAIEAFSKTCGELSFITTHNTEANTDEFDLIVTDKELDLPYSKVKVAEENFLLAYNKTAFQPDTANLKNLPFITMNDGSSMYENTMKICNRQGFNPNVVLQSEDPFYIRKCVELGLGIAIVPELSWSGQFSDDIALESVGEIRRKIYVYKKYDKNEYTDKFFATLVEHFSI